MDSSVLMPPISGVGLIAVAADRVPPLPPPATKRPAISVAVRLHATSS